MRTALLRGRDHNAIGALEAVSEGPAALCLTRGGAAKTYTHTDPNEDAAGFALGPGGQLAAIADAHRGFAASEVAVGWLLAERGEDWTGASAPDPARWHALAAEAFWRAGRAIQASNARSGATSRTTLAFALLRPAERRLFWASLGDSHCFRVTPDEAVDLAAAGHPCEVASFPGSEALDRETAAADCAAGVCEDFADVAVLASDGISERGIGFAHPDRDVLQVVTAARAARAPLRPLETARGLVERASAAHARQRAGDNVAVAVLWGAP